MDQARRFSRMVAFIAPALGLALLVGCTSTENLVGSDASWTSVGGHGGAGGRANLGGAGGHPLPTDAGLDGMPQPTDASVDRHSTSDAKGCTDGGAFICLLCSTDDVAEQAVCSGGVWTCPADLTPVGQCPPCSGLPPPSGCSCNRTTGVVTCQHDAAAADGFVGQ